MLLMQHASTNMAHPHGPAHASQVETRDGNVHIVTAPEHLVPLLSLLDCEHWVLSRAALDEACGEAMGDIMACMHPSTIVVRDTDGGYGSHVVMAHIHDCLVRDADPARLLFEGKDGPRATDRRLSPLLDLPHV